MATETGSAILLLAATLIALVWANAPWADAYAELWHTELPLTVDGTGVSLTLGHWVNDGLMAVFFFVVGLEIRRELAVGELRDRRAAAIPAVAALAGMVAPALIYVAFNAGGPGAAGWGIPMATDIAFVLGALALLGDRVPRGVRVFLLTLAIVDDLGAIAVIAVFYAAAIDPVALGLAAALVVWAWALGRLAGPRWWGPAALVTGLALWYATLQSGVHPTIAGVLMGVLTPVHARGAGAGAPANERYAARLHPWSSLLIVPLFALANAGVPLGGDALERALTSPITLGVLAGLVVGKALGITAATLGAVRGGVGPLPGGMGERHVPGAATLAGIGFTVALFVADLAFTDQALRDEAKAGVLVASLLAAVAGLAALALSGGSGGGGGGSGQPGGSGRGAEPGEPGGSGGRGEPERDSGAGSPHRSRSG